MLTRRRPLVALLAGVAAGLLVAVVAWISLFGGFVDVAPPRYPSFEAAQPVAVEEGGRYRWPGTSVRVHRIEAGRVDVERRWLGMTEAVVRVQQVGAGWDVGTPKLGPGRAVQEVVACLVPGAAVGLLVARRTSRSRPAPHKT